MKNKIIRLIQDAFSKTGYLFTVKMRYIGRKRILEVNSNLDYVRISSLELVAHEILSNHVKGNVAELGVFKGDFAKIINEAFPDRKLYLFDTFEGFEKRDIDSELQNKYSKGNQDFSDTSVELVLNKMKYKNQCVVKKGYFPETASGLEDTFAFVSIDADLYNPILHGLNYFYPRLSKGGYIFVHDYNNTEYEGARAAVKIFCSENDISFVPICDNCGTAIIIK